MGPVSRLIEIHSPSKAIGGEARRADMQMRPEREESSVGSSSITHGEFNQHVFFSSSSLGRIDGIDRRGLYGPRLDTHLIDFLDDDCCKKCGIRERERERC